MRVCSPRALTLIAMALIPLPVSAQESSHLVSVPEATLPNFTPPPMSLTPPQASGEKSVALTSTLR